MNEPTWYVEAHPRVYGADAKSLKKAFWVDG